MNLVSNNAFAYLKAVKDKFEVNRPITTCPSRPCAISKAQGILNPLFNPPAANTTVRPRSVRRIFGGFLLECIGLQKSARTGSGQGKDEQYSRGKVPGSYQIHRIAKIFSELIFWAEDRGRRRWIGLMEGSAE
jgi:hypothetical protein